MTETLRTISTTLNWNFNYGRSDFHNLTQATSEDDLTYYLFVDPIFSDDGYNSNGDHQGYIEHSGKMMLLVKSDLADVYDKQLGNDESDGKWTKHIKPIKDQGGQLTLFKNELNCPGNFSITQWKVQEVINYLDDNMDGVIINYRIREFI